MAETDSIFQHSVNKGILECLKYLGRHWRGPLSCHPSEAHDPYYQLGTHPDLVEKLWDKLTVNIPLDTRWVLFARPVLVHPETGVIFAFATGTQTYALRVPENLRREVIAEQVKQQYRYPDGHALDLTRYDPDWIFADNIANEAAICLLAFQSAALAT
jgi:hypothetical protein